MAFGSLHFDGVAYLEGIDVLGEDASTGEFGVCVGAVDFGYEGYGAGCFAGWGHWRVSPIVGRLCIVVANDAIDLAVVVDCRAGCCP